LSLLLTRGCLDSLAPSPQNPPEGLLLLLLLLVLLLLQLSDCRIPQTHLYCILQVLVRHQQVLRPQQGLNPVLLCPLQQHC
jgi:hypothetical protein